MVKYEKVPGTEFPVYDVRFEEREGVVSKTGETKRSKRWKLEVAGEDTKFFKSRRAAFYWFEYQERFETNPVYATLGGRKGTKRIR